MKNPIITLLTDFGTKDTFVGTAKGVILSICPNAQLVDLSHEVPPQSVLTGSFLLRSAVGYFPKGTVHLAVVDPGVGSARKAIALKSNGQFFVGPDNGLFSAALDGKGIEQIVELNNPKFQLPNPSTTFHGRDVFAPVAGHLAKGIPLNRLGAKLNNCIWRQIPRPFKTTKGWTGEVLWVDRFGNLVTNLEKKHIPKAFRLKLGKTVILTMGTHYAAAKKGTAIALIGSFNNLEISISGGNAAQKLGVGIGASVVLG